MADEHRKNDGNDHSDFDRLNYGYRRLRPTDKATKSNATYAQADLLIKSINRSRAQTD